MSAIGKQETLAQLEGTDAKERIEVVVRQTGGLRTLQIRSLRWGKGVGWYVQKTIEVSHAQAGELAQLLRRHSLPKTGSRGKVIPFPD
jgi:hypothetical protein